MMPGLEENRVSIVSVAFNSAGIIGRMLASLPPSVTCIIVDNGSEDIISLRQLALSHGAQLVENQKNVGFGTACNQGSKLAKSEFLLFLNPDARLAPRALENLVEAADRHPEAVAFNPKILDEHGARKLKRKSHLVGRAEWLPAVGQEREQELPFLHGSALFVRTDAFRKIGGFDENIFLFYEDDDLSIRLRHEFGALRFVPEALVEHVGGASSSGADTRLFKAWHYGYARLYATRKFGRPLAGLVSLVSPILKIFRISTLLEPFQVREAFAQVRGAIAAIRGYPPGS